MDSLTQIVLGAATAEAVVGRKLGNKALLLGAIAGTIPDLDVIAAPFLSPVQELVFHRSFSHSLLFAGFGGALFAYGAWKLFSWKKIQFRDLFWVFSLCFLTHILLDTCTTWGTQLLWPFTSYGYALYNVFVVDPFYTLPFLGCVIAVAFLSRTHAWRVRINTLGLLLSSAYLGAGLLLQQQAARVFQNNLNQQEIVVDQMITKTTPFNIVLWTCTVKTADGYYTGFYSFFDADTQVEFVFEPGQEALLTPYVNYPEVRTLLQVTKGFYTMERTENGVQMNDLRFGKFNGWQGEEKGEYVFKYTLEPQEAGPPIITQVNYRKPIDGDYLRAFMRRVMGHK